MNRRPCATCSRPTAAGPVTVGPAGPELVRVLRTYPDDGGGQPWPDAVEWWTDDGEHVTATLVWRPEQYVRAAGWAIAVDDVHVGWTDNPWTVIANGWNSDRSATPTP